MFESHVALLFLGLIFLCTLSVTVILFFTTRRLRQVLHRLDRAIPTCEGTFREATLTLKEARHLLSNANKLSQQVHQAIQRTRLFANGFIHKLSGFTGGTARLHSRRRFNGE